MKKISGNVVILLDKNKSDTIESSNEKGTANSLTSMKRTEPKKSFVILSPLKTLLIFHHQWCFVCKQISCKDFELDFSGSFHLNLICF